MGPLLSSDKASAAGRQACLEAVNTSSRVEWGFTCADLCKKDSAESGG